ncbi:cytochrome P450 [Acetobacter persici]|uniref:cytochrome P450 n=1 Tax=Acetobacter persici TaxID=1076596 RepID=UPI001F21860A|nr:cytochrome P450 [Acetobacter persici]MCG0999488.1 cytochrome P450 [Acetobacter persici]
MTDLVMERDPYLPWVDPEFRKNPYPWYAKLQQEKPVYKMSERDFVVSRYDDYIEYLKHPAMSMTEPDWVKPHSWRIFKDTVLFYNPPRHTEARRHMAKWFTPKMSREWTKHTAQVARDELAKISSDGVVEAHHHLCVLPAHITMCRILQVDESDPEGVIENTLRIVMAQSPVSTAEQEADSLKGFDYLFGRCRDMIADKRRNPGSGMLDALLAAQDRGEVSADEVLETLVLLYFSGAPNPAYVLASSLEHFARNPEVLSVYREQPEKRLAIVNELFRLYPPEISFTRFVTEDIEIRGVHIPKGSRIRFMTAAANRDEDVFENPNEFDYTRPPEKSHNVTFGVGTHSCAGQIISRAEVETVLTVIADAVEKIELAGEPMFMSDDRIRNYTALPLRLFMRSDAI